MSDRSAAKKTDDGHQGKGCQRGVSSGLTLWENDIMKSSGFCGAEEENGGRGTDSPGGRHPNRTNGNPTPITSPKFLQAGCPSCRPTHASRLLIYIYIAAGHHTWRSFPYPPHGDAAGSLQQGPSKKLELELLEILFGLYWVQETMWWVSLFPQGNEQF